MATEPRRSVTFGREDSSNGRRYTGRPQAVPELPDVSVYIEALTERIVGRRLDRVLLRSPFVLRSVQPPIEAVNGAFVRSLRRLGKRIVFVFDDELFLVIHLMIAGRLRWRELGEKPGIGSKLLLAMFEFEHGTLLFTEAGSRKRASIQLVRGESALRSLDRGGVEPLDDLARAVSRRVDAREPHDQAHAHRSTSVQRNRQCVLRRNSPCGTSVAAEVVARAERRGGRSPLRSDAFDAARLDGTPSRRGRADAFPRR